MADRILALDEGTRLFLLAPIVRGRKGEYRKELLELQKKGFQRVKVDGKFYEIGETPALDKKIKHDIEVVVDRIAVKKDIGNRLPDSIETALNLSEGLVIAEFADVKEKGEPKRLMMSSKFACPVSGFTIPEIEPRLFSFNNPHGACPACDGLGTQLYFDPALVVPDETINLKNGALAPWHKSSSPYYLQTLEALGRHYKFSLTVPWEDLPKKARDIILYGSGEDEIKFIYDDGMRRYETKKTFEGVIPNMQRRYKETDSSWIREEMERYQDTSPCDVCKGYRLKPEALAVKIAGKHIGEVCAQSIRLADIWFRDLDKDLSKKQQEIAARILKEIRARLKFLNNVGLDYLTLARGSGTLSGGESQRIRLASQIGSGLTGVLYVLDEPSIGLHQRDNAKLLESLKGLRDLGNSVIVVEHDEEAIRQADHVIDMGLGAGIHGGEIIAEGTPEDIMRSPKSLTGKYLVGIEQIPVPPKRRKAVHDRWLKVVGARGNNLKNVSAQIPLGTFTSTSRRSAARRGRILRPIRAPLRTSATGSPNCRNRRRAATRRDASRSMSKAAAAKRARATASSRSRCTFCRMSMSNAMSARASATTAKRSM
jgi:excinuclease ABC subunit A